MCIAAWCLAAHHFTIISQRRHAATISSQSVQIALEQKSHQPPVGRPHQEHGGRTGSWLACCSRCSAHAKAKRNSARRRRSSRVASCGRANGHCFGKVITRLPMTSCEGKGAGFPCASAHALAKRNSAVGCETPLLSVAVKRCHCRWLSAAMAPNEYARCR